MEKYGLVTIVSVHQKWVLYVKPCNIVIRNPIPDPSGNVGVFPCWWLKVVYTSTRIQLVLYRIIVIYHCSYIMVVLYPLFFH